MEHIKLHSMTDGGGGRNVGAFCRSMSCFGEANEAALKFLEDGDHDQLTNLLAEVCPVDDENSNALDAASGKARFPLPEDHWINAPFGSDQKFATLLEMAIGQGKTWAVRLLISAGARADMYNEQLRRAPIHVAASGGQLEMVKLLLEQATQKPRVNAANVDAVDRAGQTVLHIAAERGDEAMLRYILQRPGLSDVDPKDLLGGQTPLYLAAKRGKGEACQILIEHGASLLHKCFGKTVHEVILSELPHFDATEVKVTSSSSSAGGRRNVGESLRGLLDRGQRNASKGLSNSHNLVMFSIYLQQAEAAHLDAHDACGMSLMQKACNYGLHDHVQLMLDADMNPEAVVAECATKPVLLAAYYGFDKVLHALKKHKVSSGDKGNGGTTNFAVVEPAVKSRNSVLHWILKRPALDHENPLTDYRASLDLLTRPSKSDAFNEEISRVINHRDELKNSPLHYATQQWDQATARMLMERGANIGMRNLFEETPISLILPETMEQFLDDHCLTSRGEVTHEDFEIEFNYSFLAPPVDDPVFDEGDPEGQKMVEEAALPETESLWYMSQSRPHRRLLNHPVIASFLWLKWQRIRGYFNRNLRFYLMFVTCLTWYIFERFGGTSVRTTRLKAGNASTTGDPGGPESFCSPLAERTEPGYSAWYVTFALHCGLQLFLIMRDWRHDCLSCDILRTGFQVLSFAWLEVLTGAMAAALLLLKTGPLWHVLTVLLALLMFREVCQMSASLKRYLLSPENWMEMLMIALVGVVMWCPDSTLGSSNCALKRHLAAVALVLSWAEFVTLVARHPNLARYNIYVTMFYRVLQTFFFFLLWYSFFIVAFGLGFYIMLHTDTDPNKMGAIDPASDYYFFDSPWLALVKTATMFVGEIEFADIPIGVVGVDDASPVIAYLFLLAFVFLIVVVLMNLLNGLAVSDTGMIREKAEVVSAISRVETISYIESLLLGDPFDFLSNWPLISWIRSLPSLALSRCLCRSRAIRDCSYRLTGATGILLFYSTLDASKKKTICPNRRRGALAGCLDGREMSAEVVAQCKTIVIRREEEERRNRSVAESAAKAEDRVGELSERLRGVEATLEKLVVSLQQSARN